MIYRVAKWIVSRRDSLLSDDDLTKVRSVAIRYRNQLAEAREKVMELNAIVQQRDMALTEMRSELLDRERSQIQLEGQVSIMQGELDLYEARCSRAETAVRALQAQDERKRFEAEHGR